MDTPQFLQFCNTLAGSKFVQIHVFVLWYSYCIWSSFETYQFYDPNFLRNVAMVKEKVKVKVKLKVAVDRQSHINLVF